MSRKAVIAVSAVVAIVAAGVALLIAGVGTATADEVRFQNVTDPGRAPFTEPTDVPISSSGSKSTSGSAAADRLDGEAIRRQLADVESSGSTASDSSASGGSDSSGGSQGKRGAFGGSGSETVCNREKLIEELVADSGKLEAWADTMGIDSDPQAVADLIRELRPSTLTQDTQVTTHSYVGGEARSYQAILRAGTAVLVDEDGTPVVRCRCGNPLTEPLELEPETKCVNCPASYSPPPPCEGRCARSEPAAPPVQPIGTPPPPPPPPPPPRPPEKGKGGPTPEELTPPPPDDIKSAKDALDACRQAKRSLDLCRAEYHKTRALCGVSPLNPSCDQTVCVTVVSENASPDGCPTLLDGEYARQVCGDSPTKEQIERCLGPIVVFVAECVADLDKCPKIDRDRRRESLVQRCFHVPGKPECGSVQVDCAKNPTPGLCDRLRNACTTNGARPDCKVLDQFKLDCAKKPAPPQCKGLPEPGAATPTIAPGDEAAEPDAEGEEPGAPDQAPGTDGGTGTDADGGDTGEGEPAPESVPAPEGQ